MKLIALILGLVLERVATRVLHLREPRWLDGFFDLGLRIARPAGRWLAYLPIVFALLVLLAPVFWISIELQGTATRLWDAAYLVFAVLVVFFCLGPRDLDSEVSEYCAALDRGDDERARRVLTEIVESGRSGDRDRDIDVIEEAIFVQATNRVFGMVFWFIVLGPVGAWLFRVADLFRRRTAFEAGRTAARPDAASAAVDAIHGVLVWIPARLAMLGYALSGSFDDAVNGWRSYRLPAGVPFHRSSDQLAARVGKAAMTGFLEQPANSSAAARNSMRLVKRTLFIWVTSIAALTIFGWAV